MLKKITFVLIIVLLSSCGTTNKLKKEFSKEDKGNTSFKGFVLYNLTTKKELINHNGKKYFTPASNTKLFTFYTIYKTLGDSIKGLEYYKTVDSLIIKGTADPSLLYTSESNKILDFLKNSKTPIYLIDGTIDEPHYGSGWAWDDYTYYYMPGKSLLPTNGNILRYSVENDIISSNITAFIDKIFFSNGSLRRETSENKFYAKREKNKEYEVPFITSNELTAQLLSDEIDKNVVLIPNKKYNFKPLYSEKKDILLAKLLVDSDNFISEQLMLQVGYEVSKKHSVKEAIKYSLDNYLQDLPETPRWVDGSGLSRYNLFTPNDIIHLLAKMHDEIPQEKLFSYFPNKEKTFVFAKSGSLSNNYNLSGYLITKKGTLLIFSYMNNHFKESSSEVKNRISETIQEIYNKY